MNFTEIPIAQIVAFLVSVGGISFLLERLPGWGTLPADLKKVIVNTLAAILPFVANIIAPAVPGDIYYGTLGQLIVAAFNIVAMAVVHWLDLAFSGLAKQISTTAKTTEGAV